MALPIIVLCGVAGSGKDTVGNIIKERYMAQCIALADPLKRLVQQLFQFTDEQLWGPSDCRDAVDPRFTGTAAELSWEMVRRKFNGFESLYKDIGFRLPDGAIDTLYSVVGTLAYKHGYVFGTPVKATSATKGLTPRYALQVIGTEWGRVYYPNIWIDQTERAAMHLLAGRAAYDKSKGVVGSHVSTPMVVITDARFRNEILAFKRIGARIVKVACFDDHLKIVNGAKEHPSEMEQLTIPDHWFDAIISNSKSKGLDYLYNCVGAVFARWTY